MSYYADLDVSVIDELPRVETHRQPNLQKVRAAWRSCGASRILRRGTPGVLGMPLIEESEQLQLQTALETYAPEGGISRA